MAIDILSAFEHEPEPLDFVLPNMIAGTVGGLVSPGGAGKSMLALQIAATLAGGPDLLQLEDYKTGPVAYLPAEDPAIAVRHRLHSLGAHLSPEQREAVAEKMLVEPLLGTEPDVLDDRWFDALIRVATDRRLLILDTLRRFHLADENDSGSMARIIARLEAIAARTGCSVIFLHHSSKAAALGGQGDQQQASRGSSVLVDNVRWQAFLTGMNSQEVEQYGIEESMKRMFIRFGVSKANYGAPREDIWYRRHEGGVLRPAVLEKAQRKGKGGRSEYSD